MDFFSEGKAVMLDEPVVTDTTILDDDDEVVAMIKELLQERVRKKSPPLCVPVRPLALPAFRSETSAGKIYWKNPLEESVGIFCWEKCFGEIRWGNV